MGVMQYCYSGARCVFGKGGGLLIYAPWLPSEWDVSRSRELDATRSARGLG